MQDYQHNDYQHDDYQYDDYQHDDYKYDVYFRAIKRVQQAHLLENTNKAERKSLLLLSTRQITELLNSAVGEAEQDSACSWQT